MSSSTFFSSISRSALVGFSTEHVRGDELQHVLVAGDDEDVEILLGGLARQSADHVVGFVAGIFQDGQAHGFAIAAHEGNLDGEIVGHGRALGFVSGEKLVAESGRG